MAYYNVVQWSFAILTIACLGFIFIGLKKTLALASHANAKNIMIQFSVGMLVWLVILMVLSISGFLSNFDTMPARMFIVLGVPLIVLIVILVKGKMSNLLKYVPPQWLIHIQVFRFFVEVLLWMLFLDNLLPIQMTLEGRNMDIIAGITAPIVALVCFGGSRFKRNWAIIWNCIGLGLLANIVIIAILSFPTPFRVFMNEPANTIVAQFPIVFLPGILVPIAYWMHIFSLKQLLAKD